MTLPRQSVRIMPSLLAAHMGRLEAEAQRAEASRADALHLDIMDGHFVPNLSMGPAVVAMARQSVRIPLNVHLMISEPDRYADRFMDAGASSLLVHVELPCVNRALLDHIRSRGVRPGIVLNPDTPIDAAWTLLPFADEVLFMSVHPGFGGQAFLPSVLPKIAALSIHCRTEGWAPDILVDGGIDTDRAALCAGHGATAFIAGTFLFQAPDMAHAILCMRTAARNTYGTYLPHP